MSKFDELCGLAKKITGIDIRYTRSRKRELVHIRCAIVNVMRKYYSLNTVQIAAAFDMHHTTVVHHCKDHPSRYRYDVEYADLYDKMVRHAIDTGETINTEKMVQLMRSALAV